MKTIALLLVTAAVSPCVARSDSHDPNRFEFSARMTFNVTAKFNEVGGYPRQNDPGTFTGHGINRNYDDGYVRVDGDKNAGGVTWHWGYRDTSQVPGNDTLLLNSSTASPTGSSSVGINEPSLGYEIGWLRDMWRTEKWAAGFKLGFAYNAFEFRDSAAVFSPSTRITDTFSLGGIIPPGDPNRPGYQYQGVGDIPGPVIDDQPLQRGTVDVANGAVTTGNRRLDAEALILKLGPWFEIPLTSRLSAQLGAGGALAYLDTTYRYDESTFIAGTGSFAHHGSGSGSGLVGGGYVAAILNLRLTDHTSLTGGGELLALDTYRDHVGGRPIEIDLNTSWAIHFGILFTF
jgi:hypothetical protein